MPRKDYMLVTDYFDNIFGLFYHMLTVIFDTPVLQVFLYFIILVFIFRLFRLLICGLS